MELQIDENLKRHWQIEDRQVGIRLWVKNEPQDDFALLSPFFYSLPSPALQIAVLEPQSSIPKSQFKSTSICRTHYDLAQRNRTQLTKNREKPWRIMLRIWTNYKV